MTLNLLQVFKDAVRPRMPEQDLCRTKHLNADIFKALLRRLKNYVNAKSTAFKVNSERDLSYM